MDPASWDCASGSIGVEFCVFGFFRWDVLGTFLAAGLFLAAGFFKTCSVGWLLALLLLLPLLLVSLSVCKFSSRFFKDSGVGGVGPN